MIVEVKSFAWTMGLGMAAGATVALMLPRQSTARRVAQKAVNSLEHTVGDVVEKTSHRMKH